MRIGPSHQAGSDSLLTAATFFKMRELYFNDKIDDDMYSGHLYGLGQMYNVGLNGDAKLLTLAEREPRHLTGMNMTLPTPTLATFGNTPIPTPFAPPPLNMFARGGMAILTER